MAIFAEGVESIRLACSLVLLLPAIGVVALGDRRVALVPVWVATLVFVAWLRFVGWFDLAPGGAVHIAAGVALVAIAAAAWRLDRLGVDVTATALAATVAAWTWVPCVGRELGAVLNDAHEAPWSQLAPTAGYMLGLFVPVVIVAATLVVAPGLAARVDQPPVRNSALAVLIVVGALVALTLFDDLAGELARRSSF